MLTIAKAVEKQNKTKQINQYCFVCLLCMGFRIESEWDLGLHFTGFNQAALYTMLRYRYVNVLSLISILICTFYHHSSTPTLFFQIRILGDRGGQWQ